MKKILIPILLFISSTSFSAILQDAKKDVIPNLTAFEFFLLVTAVLMTVALVIITFNLRNKVSAIIKAINKDNPDVVEMENRTFWQKIGGLKPLSMEAKQIMDHKYDGIEELDNPTPPWFMYLFYATIAFAVFYGIGYHIMGDGQVMKNEYAEELAVAEKQQVEYQKKFANAVNENNVTFLKDAKAIDDGKKIYTQNCLACHGDKGQGGVGPNMTDEYWIHGGSAKDIFHTITVGVPEKGMISWKKTLNPMQIQHVISFMNTLQGTKPENAKEPQGEKYVANVQ